MKRLALLAIAGPLAAAPIAAQTALRPGQAVAGMIDTPTRPYSFGETDSYTYRARAGELVTIKVSSTAFAPHFRLTRSKELLNGASAPRGSVAQTTFFAETDA